MTSNNGSPFMWPPRQHPPVGTTPIILPPLENLQRSNNQYARFNSTRSKKALLIGIDYSQYQRGRLQGCIEDVKKKSEYLIKNDGYEMKDIMILTDDEKSLPSLKATKQNILEAMNWLFEDADPNDELFFQYSGPGAGGTIYPTDFMEVEHIPDNYVYSTIAKTIPAGVYWSVVFHSHNFTFEKV